jgi:hypothetical protein
MYKHQLVAAVKESAAVKAANTGFLDLAAAKTIN